MEQLMGADTIVIEVVGLPAPQGSKTRMPNGAMLDGKSPAQRARHKAWRTAVTDAAMSWREAWEHTFDLPMARPVGVTVQFRMPLPTSDPYRTHHHSTPDIDKLLRNTFDGLVHAGLLGDDAHICAVSAAKVYARPGGVTGASIRIHSFAAEEAASRAELKAKARRKAS